MISRQPAEWASHRAVWIGFPSHPELWEDDLAPAQAEVVALAEAVNADGAGEHTILVAAHEDAAAQARALLRPLAREQVIVAPFGDVWLRDTGPILIAAGGRLEARDFAFNGWGGKYDLAHDDTIGTRLAERLGVPTRRCDWILEGGAIDVDGTGLAVTTEQCLLNPNRNPARSKADVEAMLARDLGIDRVLWLGEGLAHDHTDGHVDNLARFVGTGRLLVPEPDGPDDPNAAAYADARARAADFGLQLMSMPSPGRVERDGAVVPASYMNFYIGNAVVVVPLYGAANDQAAVTALIQLFPGRRIVGLRADHLLTGGGSFHCISQQVPAL